jgi:HEAT repeat protein
MPNEEVIRALIEQLDDPSRSNQALLALLMKGGDGVRALAEFLLSSKPSCLPEARLLAVEGLSILKGPEALSVLVSVASRQLGEISDPVVRLGEETVASRAALALAEFPSPRAREALLKLLEGKPLVGVAEAFAKSWDLRAIPYLVSWLEDDFVAEVASRAITVCGRMAFSALLDSLGETHTQSGSETRMSQRRRARVLEILAGLLRREELNLIESALDDPVEMVRLNGARAFLAQGTHMQKEHAFEVALRLLDSSDRALRTCSEEILLENFALGHQQVEEEIRRRELAGESAEEFFPKESTLVILQRIRKNGKQLMEAQQ